VQTLKCKEHLNVFNEEPKFTEAELVFGVWCLVFGVWCMIFGVWGVGFGVWCMVSGDWCLVFDVWCVAFGIWYLVFGVEGWRNMLHPHGDLGRGGV
jgi:hypothetical protein